MTHDAYSTKRVTVWDETRDGKEGKAIKYQDGFMSWCPDEIYARDYQPVDTLSFGHALHALKDGHRVARAGWNGKGMFLIYIAGTPNVEPREGTPYAALSVSPNGVVTINPHIDMKTATGEMQPGWLASQTDMLANDWQILTA